MSATNIYHNTGLDHHIYELQCMRTDISRYETMLAEKDRVQYLHGNFEAARELALALHMQLDSIIKELVDKRTKEGKT